MIPLIKSDSGQHSQFLRCLKQDYLVYHHNKIIPPIIADTLVMECFAVLIRTHCQGGRARGVQAASGKRVAQFGKEESGKWRGGEHSGQRAECDRR